MRRRPSILVIFLTVFIDLVGFGIVVPLISLYGRDYGASGLMIGGIIASFSAMQLVFSPIWGRWSDRYGRRPILLVSTAGAALSYVLFALASGLANHATALWLLLLSRVSAGICGGNITVAQAYIADITPAEDRSRRMGLVGMAFGLGFIFGPAISGIALKLFGHAGPGWIAAVLCAANFLLASIVLAESRKPGAQAPQRPSLSRWRIVLARPRVGLLIGIFFLATFAFSCFETTLPLLVSDNFRLRTGYGETQSAATVTWLFVFCGLIGAVVQGGAIGPLVKRYGEPRLMAVSLILCGISLAGLPFIRGNGPLSWGALVQGQDWTWAGMLVMLGLLAVGTGLTRPPLFGLLSNLTPSGEQGITIGVAQSAGSFARILGPLFAATLYSQSPPLPYVICALVSVCAAGLTVCRLCRREPAPVAAAATDLAS